MSAFFLSLALLFGCPPAYLATAGGCVDLPASAVVRVYDGDTLTVRIEEWPPLFRELGVRLIGLDTPEIRGRCDEEKRLAVEAREALVAMIAEGQSVRLSDIAPDKHFRILAVVSVDGVPAAESLIAAGLARPYGGGTREGWCP